MPRDVSTPGSHTGPEAGRVVTKSPDEVDQRLVELLRRDGRMSISQLATAASVSRANAYLRFDRLVRDGVIRGFGARVDPAKLGLDVTALILVNVDQRSWRGAREELLALPGVVYLALTTGAFDFVLIVRVRDVESLRDVVLERLQGMPEIRSTQTIFVLEEDDRLS